MNYPLWVPNPAKPDATKPWHPETHVDIERLQLEDLPRYVSVQHNLDGLVFCTGWSCFRKSPNQIRESMKQLFFTHATATFVCGDGEVFAYVHPVDVRESVG
jgi:hypothetical protein